MPCDLNGGKNTAQKMILIENASIASICLFCCFFVCFVLLLFPFDSYCELLIANCHQKCFRNMTENHFEFWNNISHSFRLNCRLISFSQFTMQCNAVCSKFSWMCFYMFLLSLVPVKNENPALQQIRGIWRAYFECLQPGCIPNGIQNFWSEWFHFVISEMNCVERHPSWWLIRNPMI